MSLFTISVPCENGNHEVCRKSTCICDCHHGERGLIAVLTFDGPSGRASMNVFGTKETLDNRIIDAIGVLRSAGKRMVKTEMSINGEDWVYEYDSTGHVERTFRLGEVTP